MEISTEVTPRLRAARSAVGWAFDPHRDWTLRQRWSFLWGAVVLTVRALVFAFRP